MGRYAIRRLLQSIPVLIGITVIAFILMDIVPGSAVSMMMDPRTAQMSPEVEARLIAHYGLDDPAPLRYGKFLLNALRGDLGFSLRFNSPVTWIVAERLPSTALLAASAGTLAVIVGIALGIMAALHRGKFLDSVSMVLAMAGASMPVFWFGLLLMLLFSVRLGWLPASGWGDGQIQYAILPALALGYGFAAVIARVTRSSMLEVLGMDYITTARSKGLNRRVIVYKHALKNAMIPVITVVGGQVGRLLSGAVLTETVFAWPGLGRLLVDSILTRDLPTVQGCLIVIAVTFVGINLITDLMYAYLDPRVRFE
ncbi:MAG: ABC transporter permease [Clostridia bacterium]